MLQLTQKLRDGSMLVQEVPPPHLAAGMVLVRNHYSLISAGTEGSTAKAARKSLIGKMKERPDQVKQVLEMVQKVGITQAYRAVTKKLEAYSPCGYSSSGVVVAVGEGVREFQAGDYVACAGAGYANHAELVSVPVNLCVKLPAGADLKAACYNTLGAIAMQGVRQADVRLGERVAVIGLGILGQLTGLLLKASGVRVVGIDVSVSAVRLALETGMDLAVERSAPGVEAQIKEFTGGLGVDAVIITAGASSLDPVNFAGAIARKKGKVVVVGAVPTGFDRNPDYYPKELELRMSCSYGPGRYDPLYEEKGVDYPAAYVRWTEKRNMEAFQDLLQAGALKIDRLTTHEFPLEDSPKAYDMIVNRTEPFSGVVIAYDTHKEMSREAVVVGGPVASSDINIAFIGAGSYAQGSLLPNLPSDLGRIGVMSNSGTTSKRVAERFGFEFCTADEKDILENAKINTVFIATRHDSHASYAAKALARNKHVFLEKPVALNADELKTVMAARSGSSGQLMVGFNRRFAPLATEMRKHLPKVPMSMAFRVNAGPIPADHWIQDMKTGGGRMVGEGCHFIDFMAFVCNAVPVRVYASQLAEAGNSHDTVSVSIDFADGSVGTLHYFANGSKEMGKEYFEVYAAGVCCVLDDFRELAVYGQKRLRVKKVQDKGQEQMLKAFFAAVRRGHHCIEPQFLEKVALATFAVNESLQTRQPVAL